MCTRVAVFISLYIMRNVMLIIIGNVYFKNSIHNQYGAASSVTFSQNQSAI